MGLYDRDYVQDEYESRSRGFQPRTMVLNLIILNAVLFLLNVLLGADPGGHPDDASGWRLVRWLSLTPPDLLQPWMWWKLVTCGFVHDPRDIGHIFWNMLGLFIFGRDVEARYGRWEFLRFYLAAIVLGSLAWSLRLNLQDVENARVLGASGAVSGVIMLFVYNFPHRTILLFFVLPVPAWVLGVLLIVGDATGFLGWGGGRTAFDVHLAGAALATGYFWFGWNLGRLSPESLRGGIRWPRFRRRPKLRVHDPGDKQRRQDEEADRVLEKVSREGLDSLTSKERRILDDYSRRVREKKGG